MPSRDQYLRPSEKQSASPKCLGLLALERAIKKRPRKIEAFFLWRLSYSSDASPVTAASEDPQQHEEQVDEVEIQFQRS
jgi:hypothetical protein